MKTSLLFVLPLLAAALVVVLAPGFCRDVAHKAHEALFGFMARQGLVLMAFTNTNDQINGRKPIRMPQGAEVVHERFTLSMATGDMALNTIGQIGILPAGCVPVDVRIGGSDPDASTAAMVMQIGIWDGSSANISTSAADGGAHWGVNTAVTAAFDQALTRNGTAMLTVSPSTSERKIGGKVTTAPTTAQAWTLYLDVWYRAAPAA